MTYRFRLRKSATISDFFHLTRDLSAQLSCWACSSEIKSKKVIVKQHSKKDENLNLYWSVSIKRLCIYWQVLINKLYIKYYRQTQLKLMSNENNLYKNFSLFHKTWGGKYPHQYTEKKKKTSSSLLQNIYIYKKL